MIFIFYPYLKFQQNKQEINKWITNLQHHHQYKTPRLWIWENIWQSYSWTASERTPETLCSTLKPRERPPLLCQVPGNIACYLWQHISGIFGANKFKFCSCFLICVRFDFFIYTTKLRFLCGLNETAYLEHFASNVGYNVFSRSCKLLILFMIA